VCVRLFCFFFVCSSLVCVTFLDSGSVFGSDSFFGFLKKRPDTRGARGRQTHLNAEGTVKFAKH
jgi:hypothetical protein